MGAKISHGHHHHGIGLGDSFKLSGLSDTSGNSGFNEFADEFSFCSGGLAGCEAGIFAY